MVSDLFHWSPPLMQTNGTNIVNNAAEQLDFISVTERGGETVSQAQLDRFYQRYIWAGKFAQDVDCRGGTLTYLAAELGVPWPPEERKS